MKNTINWELSFSCFLKNNDYVKFFIGFDNNSKLATKVLGDFGKETEIKVKNLEKDLENLSLNGDNYIDKFDLIEFLIADFCDGKEYNLSNAREENVVDSYNFKTEISFLKERISKITGEKEILIKKSGNETIFSVWVGENFEQNKIKLENALSKLIEIKEISFEKDSNSLLLSIDSNLIDFYLNESKENNEQIYADTIIINPENKKILLLLRNVFDDLEPNTYCFPGGKIEEGETIEEGCLRELKEETKYEKEIEDIKFIEKIIYNDGAISYYYVTTCNEDPVIENEYQKFEWFDIDELENLNIIFNNNEVYQSLVKKSYELLFGEKINDKIYESLTLKKYTKYKNFTDLVSKINNKNELNDLIDNMFLVYGDINLVVKSKIKMVVFRDDLNNNGFFVLTNNPKNLKDYLIKNKIRFKDSKSNMNESIAKNIISKNFFGSSQFIIEKNIIKCENHKLYESLKEKLILNLIDYKELSPTKYYRIKLNEDNQILKENNLEDYITNENLLLNFLNENFNFEKDKKKEIFWKIKRNDVSLIKFLMESLEVEINGEKWTKETLTKWWSESHKELIDELNKQKNNLSQTQDKDQQKEIKDEINKINSKIKELKFEYNELTKEYNSKLKDNKKEKVEEPKKEQTKEQTKKQEETINDKNNIIKKINSLKKQKRDSTIQYNELILKSKSEKEKLNYRLEKQKIISNIEDEIEELEEMKNNNVYGKSIQKNISNKVKKVTKSISNWKNKIERGVENFDRNLNNFLSS
jgi:8-oxo-dGTP pyrophosphatase MutT (NUDIX family)